MKHSINIGCLNVRGCRAKRIQNTIIEDCQRYDLQILVISETHLKGNSLDKHTTTDQYNKINSYSMFYNGNEHHTHHGVGLIIDQDLQPSFKRISDRICTASM